MSRNANNPSAKRIADRLKEKYPLLYDSIKEELRKELLEFNRNYAKKKYHTTSYKEWQAKYMREYYKKNRETILENGKRYRERADYDAHRKLKGAKNED